MPNFWWRTSAANAREWVQSDPDVDDGSPRHPDVEAQRWERVAVVVAAVGDAVAAGAWTPEAGTTYGIVKVAGYPGDLTATEQRIVEAWFSYGEPVRVDPWWDQLENGRHRLWRTLPFFGDDLVPICGSALGYADPANAAAMGPSWPDTYAGQLGELDASSAFDATDPMNATFRRSMEEASAGRFPNPV